MEFAVLGPLEARANGAPVSLGGAKQRALLALLILNANRVVPRERLIDDLWGDEPPETAVASVQVYVSRLRKVLPQGTLVTRSRGYALEVEPLALDLVRFERLVDDARSAEPRRKSTLLREALSLWRGPPLADLETEPFREAAAARLAERRLVALEELIDAELALGRHTELTAELVTLIREQPHRERFRVQLALALYRSGRQAEALQAVRDARAALDELGLEPSASLRRLERQVLTQDELLDLPGERPLLRLGADDGTPTPSQLVPEPWSPFVGRSAELSLLGELLERAERGVGAVVLLCGEAGAGKTRLARQLAHEAAGRGALVLYGASDPVVRTPYQSLQEWLEFVVDVCDPDALRLLLRAEGSDLLARLVPRLAPLAEFGPVAREPGEERELLPAAAVNLLTGVSKAVPLVAIADDIQWTDSESLHVLRRLVRAAPGCRLLLVAALREPGEERSRDLDELVGDSTRLDWVTRISLGGLSSADVHALIRTAARAEASDSLVAAVAELTDGTPLLVCELWRDLLERGAVAIAGGRADLSLPLPEIHGPERLRDIVRQRVARLDPQTISLLELAAVAAVQVDLRVLAEASDLDHAALLAAVDEAVGTGIIEELPGTRPAIRFVHELLRRALYDRLSSLRRAELHGRFGKALEAVHASEVAAVIAELAYHFTQAVPVLGPEPAVDYNRRAAAAAARSLAFDDAIARLTTALELGVPDDQRRSAQVELLYLLQETGRTDEAVALLTPGIESSPVRMRLFLSGARMGDPDVDPADMRAAAEEALTTFAALGDEHGVSHAYRSLALALRRQGRLAECCVAAERALAHAEVADDPAQRRRPIGTLCYGLCDGPAPVPEALARCEQLVVSARGDRLFEAVATWGVAALLAMAGRADEAREQIVRRLSVFDATGRMRAIRVYRILVAEAMELVGDLDQAEQQLRVKWQLFRDERQWVPDARAMHAAYHLGQLYCDQGRWEEAERCLEYGRSVPTPDYFRHESVIRLAVAARVEAQRGNSAESIRLAHRATSLADLSDFLNLRARTWLARAEVEERGGRAVEARAAREAAANIYQAKGNTLALRRVALR